MAEWVSRKYWAMVAAVAGLVGAGVGGASQAQGVTCGDACPPPSKGPGQRVEFFTDSITSTDGTFGGQEVFGLGTLQPVEQFHPPSPCRAATFYEGKLFATGATDADQA